MGCDIEEILSTNSAKQLANELLKKTKETKKKLKVVKDDASFALVGSKKKKGRKEARSSDNFFR